MDNLALQNFISNHNVIQRTLDGFWIWMDYWRVDHPEDFDKAWNNIDNR
ncbi:hypothetical protein [Paenibacillus durus]|nr:hypothetical protein [Paenibacillus durus]